MKRLEDIPKKQSFKVPDGYFEDLPMRIQARIQSGEKKSSWLPDFSFVLKLAVPIFLVGIISLAVFNKLSKQEDVFASLDSVPATELLAYLESDDITTEEILENVSFTNAAITKLYQPQEEISADSLNEIVQQYDFNF
jgi:hypothetical protein